VSHCKEWITQLHLLLLSASTTLLHQITGIYVVLQAHKVLLDAARADEPVEDADTARFVVRAAPPSTAEGLLPDDGARAFFVVVDISRSVAERIGRLDQCSAVGGEAMIIVSTLFEDEKR
jgi:hypothetical protein